MVVSKREVYGIAKKQLTLRDQLWPGASKDLWDRRAHTGFTTIPKTMPLLLKIMDEMTKGHPVSSAYLALWCSTWDNSFVSLSKQNELAHAAGFSGQRGIRTWVSRMKLLQDLGFIDIKPGPAGLMGFALIWNPHVVIREHYQKKTPGLTEASYNALLERASDIGAKDMLEGLDSASPGAGKTAPDLEKLMSEPVGILKRMPRRRRGVSTK
jgi:hypothetical protein